MALTRRQKQVLDFLVGFINRQGYSPSFEEIGGALGVSSLATVHKHLETLAKKGFVRRGYNQSRSVEVVAVPGTVPFAKTALRGLGRRAAEAGGRVAARWSRERAPPSQLEIPLLGRGLAGAPVGAAPHPYVFSPCG